MYRHRKDSNYHLIPRTYPVVTVDEDMGDSTVVVSGGSIMTGITLSLDSAFDQFVHVYSSGNINIGTHTPGNLFTFCTWVYVSSAARHTLLDVNGKFQIILDTNTNVVILRRLVYGTTYEEFSIPCTVTLNQWTHIAVVRYYQSVSVVKNLITQGSINNYYYSIPSDITYFGNNFTGKLYNTFLYLKKRTFPGIYTDLDAFKKPHNVLTTVTENAENKIIDLHDQEVVSCSSVYPAHGGNTYYNPFDSFWKVTRATNTASFLSSVYGLTIVPPDNIKLTYPFTIEVGFKIHTELTGSNIVLASQWYSGNNRSWYLWYDLNTDNINFVYLNKANNTVNQVTLGTYRLGEVNHFAFTADKNELKLFFNGELTNTLAISLVRLHRYHFNYDNTLVSSTGAWYELHKFTVSRGKKYTTAYLPYKSSDEFKYVPVKSGIYDYHYKDEVRRNKRKGYTKLSITGSNTISPGTSQTYTALLGGVQNTNTVIRLSIRLSDRTDLYQNDFVIPTTVTIPAGSLSATFTVQLGNYSVNPYKRKFVIVGTSNSTYATKQVTISDSRVLDFSFVTTLNGYLDGYVTRDSVSAGSIPNLTASRTANTSATKVNTLHGVGYVLQSVSDVVNFNEETDVRTALLIYREMSNQSNRGYFGHDSKYTFNGGSAQELVGSLVFNPGEYIKALSLFKKGSKVKIAENDSMFVVIDESGYKVLVYERVSGVWSSTPTELDLSFGDNTVIVNASIDVASDGSAFALGFQNANNGEGVVQVWRKQSGIWVKDLHLGSPTPDPYKGGFGHAVALADSGTRLFVTQIGDSHVYVFEKDTLWSATPVETLIGSNRFGHQLSCNSAGTKLFINEVDTQTSYLYDLTTHWTLTQTITFGINGELNKAGTFLAITNSNSATVKLYDYSTTFSEVKTLTGTTNFGYAVAVNNTKDVLIGSPNEHKVYHYQADGSYNSSVVYTSPSLENTDYYGYTCGLSTHSRLVSNFYNNVELITNDTSSVPQTILAVRQDYNTANLTDVLKTTEPQVLTFYTTVPLTVNNIGKTKSNLTLNGIIYGWLLFNRILSSDEIQAIELLVKKNLVLNSYSVYDT